VTIAIKYAESYLFSVTADALQIEVLIAISRSSRSRHTVYIVLTKLPQRFLGTDSCPCLMAHMI